MCLMVVESMVPGTPRLVLLTLLDSRSRGRLADDHIELNLLSEPGDREAVRHALRQLVRATGDSLDDGAVAGPDGAAPSMIGSMSDGELDAWILTNEGGTFHATGSVPGRVGGLPANERGQVDGWPTVFVVDASVLATAPTSPPMLTIAHTVIALAAGLVG